MTELKRKAFDTAYELYNKDAISISDYESICVGLEEIEPLRNRDEVLEEMWQQFADIPMNPETECIEAPFMGWGVGVSREEIWHWFDRRHSKGVAYLLYSRAEDYVPETKRLYGLSKLCFECESLDCHFNHSGECRFALVHERKPCTNDTTGCLDYDYREVNN